MNTVYPKSMIPSLSPLPLYSLIPSLSLSLCAILLNTTCNIYSFLDYVCRYSYPTFLYVCSIGNDCFVLQMKVMHGTLYIFAMY